MGCASIGSRWLLNYQNRVSLVSLYNTYFTVFITVKANNNDWPNFTVNLKSKIAINSGIGLHILVISYM